MAAFGHVGSVAKISTCNEIPNPTLSSGLTFEILGEHCHNLDAKAAWPRRRKPSELARFV